MRVLPIAVLCAGCLVMSGARLGADVQERPTTLADQTRVNVTIYNGDLTLVHDRRHIALTSGENHVAWRDVSSNLDATSALVESISAPGGIAVLEQNFDFDLLSPDALSKKSVGQSVTVVHRRPLPGEPQRERAKVMALNGGIVLKYADRIETQLYDSYIVYDDLPANLRDVPTLILGLDSARSGAQDLELSYLTHGLGWHAEYVGQVSADGSKADLNGLVTLTNNSGAAYRNAHVQLVAGNVNAPQPNEGQLRTIGRVTARAANAQQENFFEYHLYTLPRQTTIEENQTKQVAFMSARDVPLHESLELRGSPYYYSSANADLGLHLPVAAYASFENKGGDLGVPLPGGLVRLYKTDSRGISQFLGADRIDHTPRNETVRLHVGDSFDVTAKKKQTNFHIVSDTPQIYDTAYEITLSNAKDVPVDVLVVEPIPAEWTIQAESAPHDKSSSSTASWKISVPAGGRTTLTYSVEVRFP
jgi:hypothetical protein